MGFAEFVETPAPAVFESEHGGELGLCEASGEAEGFEFVEVDFGGGVGAWCFHVIR